jgi:carbonic anhydrase/acetyltransferase-like protein (isoleucine patch superfamily)
MAHLSAEPCPGYRGHGSVRRGVRLRDAATMTIDNGALIGDGVILQGRYDGRCVVGARRWIGPQAFIASAVLGSQLLDTN